jgi:hypothetical protein
MLDEIRLLCQDDFMTCCIAKIRRMYSPMNEYYSPEDFEVSFLRVVDNLINESTELTHTGFAREICKYYPEFASGDGAPVKWRRIKNGSKNGKKQGIPLAEAYAMALALKKSFPELAFTAHQTMVATCKSSQDVAV